MKHKFPAKPSEFDLSVFLQETLAQRFKKILQSANMIQFEIWFLSTLRDQLQEDGDFYLTKIRPIDKLQRDLITEIDFDIKHVTKKENRLTVIEHETTYSISTTIIVNSI